MDLLVHSLSECVENMGYTIFILCCCTSVLYSNIDIAILHMLY